MIIDFGVHKGKDVSEVPTSYLDWIRLNYFEDHELRIEVHIELLWREYYDEAA